MDLRNYSKEIRNTVKEFDNKEIKWHVSKINKHEAQFKWDYIKTPLIIEVNTEFDVPLLLIKDEHGDDLTSGEIVGGKFGKAEDVAVKSAVTNLIKTAEHLY